MKRDNIAAVTTGLVIIVILLFIILGQGNLDKIVKIAFFSALISGIILFFNRR